MYFAMRAQPKAAWKNKRLASTLPLLLSSTRQMSLTNALHHIDYLPCAEEYFLRIQSLANPVWLDSGRPGSSHGRFDIMTAAPNQILFNPSITELNSAVVRLREQNKNTGFNTADIPFCGGVIGYFNYEYNANAFGLNQKTSDYLPSIFGVFDWALIQDHKQQKSFLVFLSQCSRQKRKEIIELCTSKTPQQPTAGFSVQGLKSDIDKEKYSQAFDKIQEYIHAGDCYQINFSQRFSGEFSGEGAAAYRHLRKVLPSPFSAYLDLSEEKILSFSPERFIKIQDRIAITQPIKGTIARGKNQVEDQELAKALHKSEKNRAENVMIVDLLRNDFSRSCIPHSVKVPELFALKSFPNVHHLVSTVQGEIAADITPLQFFSNCFPGGSITGAPKKRAMEIIAELEQSPRQIYCGSVCYYSVHGNMDSNITIRTLLINNEKIHCWGGGGIVADSTPEEEYQESLQKVGVLLKALQPS